MNLFAHISGISERYIGSNVHMGSYYPCKEKICLESPEAYYKDERKESRGWSLKSPPTRLCDLWEPRWMSEFCLLITCGLCQQPTSNLCHFGGRTVLFSRQLNSFLSVCLLGSSEMRKDRLITAKIDGSRFRDCSVALVRL